MKRIFTIVLILAMAVSLTAQQVIHAPEKFNRIADGWKWALDQTGDKKFNDGLWIGYSIERMMGLHSHIGSYCRSHDDRPSLGEIIYGTEQSRNCLPMSAEEQIQQVANKVLDDWNVSETDEQVLKELAFLFRFDSREDAKKSNMRDLKISNMSLHADLDDLPLLWLEIQDQEQSIDFLISKYSESKSHEVKEDLIVAISMNGESPRIAEFLKDVIQSDADNELREDAVFWLGQQQSEQALDFLKQIIKKDRSMDVREKAIFSVSQMDSDEATRLLIELARTANHPEIREKAIFWLSQKAGEKAVATLTDIIEEDNEQFDIKEKAIFALSQLDDNEGVPHLIRIAKTHPNPRMRKKAIFWLGQAEDERAVEALIDILQN